ncbi:MAG: glutathione binding-like protein, partial [Deltaproteobacteria bacterium]|nr:glutathione binding-like protein [Deltaproteobacteria bacterium]
VDAVRRFDKLLGDFETALADNPWLAGSEFSLADIAYAPYMVRLAHLQLQILWEKRPHVTTWFAHLKKRTGFKLAITERLNSSYLTLMEEKGKEVQPKIRAHLAELVQR